MNIRSILLSGLLSGLFLGASAEAGSLTVEIAGVTAASGKVMATVCAEAQFKGQCPMGRMTDASRGTVTLTFAEVAPGRYAVKAFHDENGNGRLDASMLGIPTEGIGFSNNASAQFGPPSFADAAFTMGSGDQRIRLRLNY